jgi:peptidoglycan/LPS O-acetylase OafA/YrhL
VSPGEGIFSWWPYVRTAISSLNYTWIALFYLCVLLIVLSHRGGVLSSILCNCWLMKVGIIAYGTYLFHEPILGLTYSLLRQQLPVIHRVTDLGVTLLALAITLALAHLSWSYFERPLILRGHRHRYQAVGQAEAEPKSDQRRLSPAKTSINRQSVSES